MNQQRKIIVGIVVLASLTAGPVQVRAQQNTEEKPKPAAREYAPLLDLNSSEQDANAEQRPSQLQPDNQPLTGVENATLGTPDMRHSYWVPGLQYVNLIGSTGFNQPGVINWGSTSYIAGNVSLLDTWTHAQLSLNYSGGSGLSTESAQGNNSFHQLAIEQTFGWRKWQLHFIDQFAYLPEAQFGFGGASSLSSPGVGGSLAPQIPGLQSNYLPDQSIFSSIGPRYSNSIATQVVYEFNPRSSITAAGSYGLLRFVEPGNVNGSDVIGNLGYNYTLRKNDTLGILYRFTEYQFSGSAQWIAGHTVNVAYGRKVTRRLGLQLFFGPDIITFRIPIANTTKQVSASGGGSLTYAMPRSGLSLTYNHRLGNGSGVLVGSNTDQISSSMYHQLGRVWRGSISFGYARNRSLVYQAQNSPSYNSYFAGAGLNRPLGPNATFSLGYTAYIQDSSQAGCNPEICNTGYTHQIWLGFSWHTRPYVLH